MLTLFIDKIINRYGINISSIYYFIYKYIIIIYKYFI